MSRTPKKKGALLEPEELEAPVDIFNETKPEPSAPLFEVTPEPLEPEEVGMKVFVLAPRHSKSFTKLADAHRRTAKVPDGGSILLPDGQVLRRGATAKAIMSPELKGMLDAGVLLAGKARR